MKKNIWPLLNLIQCHIDKTSPTDSRGTLVHPSEPTGGTPGAGSAFFPHFEKMSWAELPGPTVSSALTESADTQPESSASWCKSLERFQSSWWRPGIPTAGRTSMGSFLSSSCSDRKFKPDRKGCYNYSVCDAFRDIWGLDACIIMGRWLLTS